MAVNMRAHMVEEIVGSTIIFSFPLDPGQHHRHHQHSEGAGRARWNCGDNVIGDSKEVVVHTWCGERLLRPLLLHKIEEPVVRNTATASTSEDFVSTAAA